MTDGAPPHGAAGPYEFFTAPPADTRRVLIPRGRIFTAHFRVAFRRMRKPMLDLIFIAVGVAALGVFCLYAIALKRI